MRTHAAVNSRPFLAVFLGGGAAATLDIVYACLRNSGFGKAPIWTLQSVASGLLGAEAFESGVNGALLGVTAHYLILFVAAFVYLQVHSRVASIAAHPIVFGAVFGVLIYLFMNFVVLPLSAFPYKFAYPPLRLLEGFASHAVLVGIPIALLIRWIAGPKFNAG